ncbi:MAG: YdbH domain-containing protein [Desulfatibacillum sp.]|nr:YdbH domain-containing protein [Desulfatibacillum sp.]
MALGSKIRLILWLLLLVVAGTGLGLWFSLPGMVERRVPFYAQEAGLKNLTFEVRKIGLFQADLGSVVLGDPRAPALTVATAQVDYSPWDLIHKKIKSVRVAGVQVFASLDGQSLSLRGMDFPVSRNENPDAPSPALPRELPVDLAFLSLDSASLNLDWNGKAYRLPLEAQAVRRDAGVFDCALTIHPRGQAVKCDVMADLPGQNVSVTLKSDTLEAGRFGDLTGRIAGLLVNGGIDIQGKGGLKASGLEPILASLSFGKGEILSSPLKLVSPSDKPLTAQVSFHKNRADVSLENIHIAEPVVLEIPAIQTRIDLTDTGISAKGNFCYAVRAMPNFSVSMENPAQAKVVFSADKSLDGKLDFSIENDPPKQDIVLIHDAAIAYIAQPVWKIRGAGKNPNDFTVDFSLSFPVINVETDSAKARIPGLGVTGNLVLKEGHEPVLNAITEFKDGQAWGINPEFRVSDIRGKMPFTHPARTDRGKMSIGSVSIGGKAIGPVTLDLERKGLLMSLQGSHQDTLIPGLSMEFSGNAGLDDRGDFELHSNFGVKGHQITALDLGKFAKELKGYAFDGLLTVKGFASLEKGKLDTGMEISMRQGKIQAPEYNMEMTGIGLSLLMDDLVAVRSAPRQVFSFESVKLGNMEVTKGKVEFIVESPQSFFVERSSFGWCKGRVYSPAVHLQAGVSDYEFLLFCDRLDFVDLLRQLGAPSAKGSGSLNGIVPIRITNGQFRFDQGHLYSSPGEGGAIRIKGGDDFMGGLAAGTPQQSQLTLAKLALEDYQYEWAKLEINSEGENLLLKLQLDGKPTGPLPLVPDPKTGNFIKVDSPEKGAVFQGIKLNLNIKLPLDLLLKYGIKLKDYF